MSFSVTILGSSSALPTPARSLTAHLVNHDERFFLIDCGEGTQIQLRKLKAKSLKINHILISHLHGDHVYGIFGLLSSMSMMGRKQDLYIYCDPRLETIIKSHFNYFNDTISFQIIYKPFHPKKVQNIYDDGKLEIVAFPLKHRIPCMGFVFREKPKEKRINKFFIDELGLGIKDIVNIKRGNNYVLPNGEVILNEKLVLPSGPLYSYAYCTDTRPLESIAGYIKGVDLLYHEATFLNEDAALAKTTYHSTAGDAANIALKAGVKKLCIGHFSQRYKHESFFLKQAKYVFENTILAEDGLCIQICS
jgi:ribonuclease Z